jgi:hypothetical protein
MTNNRVKEDKTLNPMVKAMIKAGIISEEEAISRFKEDEEKELEDNSNYDLDSFNISIALFSRYKLKMPYRLAFSMLFAQSNGSSDDLYKNTQLLDFITTSIPWLYYGTDAQDRFIFSFRSSREADIFLWRKDVNEESQINYLIRMFDVYYNEYYEDEEIKNAVISLARMMGPNSEYYTEFENDKHRLILQNLDKVIDKLATMRSLNNSHNFDVSLAQIEITFTREYYGKLWGKILGKTDEESEGEAKPRLKKLKEALELAQTCIEKLRREKDTADSSKKKYTQEQINRFAYEIAYCKIAMEELSESEVSAADDKELDVQTPEYFQIYPLLVEAVNSDPVNGFSYNAMFKLFEHEYAKTNDKDDIHKLTVLSEVRGYVEEAKTLDIVNRGMNGRDEVLENIVKIEAMAVDYPVDIDTIENGGDTDFVEVFNQCLAKNKACAIVFVCQQELNKYGLLHFNENDETVKTELTEEQVEICRKVYKFISKDEYKSCVERDAFAMYLKLQVAWLLFNRRPLNIGDKEAQLTYIRNKEQWKQIRNICETCINCKDGIKKPIVYLIFALSIVQTTGGYLEAYNKAIAKIEEKAPFTSQARMRVPYIICENPGEPRKYYGTLYNVDNRKSGYLRVTGIPMEMGKKRGVRVGANNIGERFLPEKNSPIPDLEIGIGYTGFSAYTEAGRKNRGDM